MTTTSIQAAPSLPTRSDSSIGRARAIARVRRIVRADSVLCAASGLALVAGGGPLADLAGLDSSWPVRVTGAFLVVLAIALWLLADASARRLLALTPWSADGDFAWAVASVAVALGASLTGSGRALIASQALVVAAVGVVKLRAVRAVEPRRSLSSSKTAA